jgi:ATP-dependent DNA helicase RecG
MADPVLLIDRIRTSIELGESHFREFKSAYEGPSGAKTLRSKREIAQDICRTLVGFANADGGEALVGVEDSGEITGVEGLSNGVISYLVECWRDGVHKDTPLQSVTTHIVELGNHKILRLSVNKSSDTIHLTADGRCLQRREAHTLPIHFEQIHFSRQEQLSRVYDREYVISASFDDLNVDAIRVLAEHVSAGMTPDRCLQYLGLADFSPTGIVLTRAALLLFAKDVWKWHPRCHVRILRVDGVEMQTGVNYNVSSDVPIQGNILLLIEETWKHLRAHLTQTRFSESGRFEASVMYPEGACREALINAIAHRDYSQEGRSIEVFIFNDRIEVKNPGALLSSLSLSELLEKKGAHQSRNTLIARGLRELGYMREVGEGVRRMFELMSDNELEPPVLESTNSIFSVTLKNSLVYSPEHRLWLDNFSIFDLSKDERTVVVLGYNNQEISPNQVISNVGIVDIEEYRKLISGLQKKGILYSLFDKRRANSIANRRGLSRRDVPRFRIVVPDTRSVPSAESAAQTVSTKKTAERATPTSERKMPSRQRPRARGRPRERGAWRVFIGNISQNVDHGTIESFVKEQASQANVIWPEIASVIGPRYCTVLVDDERAADELVRSVSRRELDGLKLVARKARPVVVETTSSS